ncbi:MAG: hypothetical protein ACOYML_05585 [Microthrixaceae bacterium]
MITVLGGAVQVLLALLGATLIVSVLLSAVRTVVVPRGQRPALTGFVFLSVRRALDVPLRRASPASRERILSQYAPVSLVLLAATWAVLVVIGFTPIFWAIGDLSWLDALQVSGSSLTTLGFVSAEPSPARLVEVLEALIGLGLVGLMISFLPTIYAAFSRREILVAQMASRAGEPPSVATFIIRQQAIRGLDDLHDTWAEIERWFAEVEETHTSYPSLAYFRSGEHRSWLTTGGTLLDSSAMVLAAVDQEAQPAAALALRAGFLCLRELGEQFMIPYDPDPAPDDPISVTRAEFDECIDRIVAAGVAIRADRDQIWRDWAGWRVNYDAVLLGLCALVEPPEAPWSSDRVEPVKRRVFRTAWNLLRSRR